MLVMKIDILLTDTTRSVQGDGNGGGEFTQTLVASIEGLATEQILHCKNIQKYKPLEKCILNKLQ